MREQLGAHQTELAQTHVLHRTGGRPDVPGMVRVDENDANGHFAQRVKDDERRQ
jgi:hypothetical protein